MAKKLKRVALVREFPTDTKISLEEFENLTEGGSFVIYRDADKEIEKGGKFIIGVVVTEQVVQKFISSHP